MMFFDLNIPFSIEREGKSLTEKESIRNERLKITMKALELGYTSVAYNRRISGVLSDSDKCNIDLFPISKLLKLVPDYFSSSVNFHRELLGVPVNSQFRQYKRVTIDVQSSVQAAWINAGNPVLRTFDLVAVRPLNQVVFDQACQDLEVDLISLNFTQMLPFHLKLPLVQAAIKRGIYFEVSYASFISDDQARRHMLQGVKLLVAGTHGKNLIFTSSASTVNGIRGPNDVANLSTLFGLSIEYAKASVSKNCRSLITNSLRRKQCYKESFEVQRPPPYDSLGFENSWLNDWHILDEGADVPTEELFSEKVDQRQSENFVALGGLAIEMPLEGVLFKVEMKQGKDLVSAADIMPLEQVLAGKEEPEHIKDLVQNDGPTIHIPKSDDTPLEGSLANTSRKQGDGLVLIADVVPLEKVLLGKEEPEQTKDLVAIDSSIVDMAGADVMPQEEVIAEMEELKHATEPVAIDGPTMHMPRSDVIPQEEVAVETDELEHTADPVMVDGPTIHIPRSGKHRFKRKSLARTYPLPFRGILKSLLFKRKPRKVLKWRSFL